MKTGKSRWTSGEILNDNEITQGNPKNDEAKKHLFHNVLRISTKPKKMMGVPFRFEVVGRFVCQDCKVTFYAYNCVEDEKKKAKYLTDFSDET